MIKTAMNSQEKQAAIGLALLYALRMFGLFSLLPVLALEAKDLVGSTPTLIGLAIGIYGATQAILQLPMGVLSDKIGRKPVIITGLLVFALGSAIAAYSDSIGWLIVGRALQGAGAISASVLALAADLSRVDQRSKVMAIIGISIGGSFVLSMIMGPLIVGWIGLSGLFLAIVVLSLLAIGIVIWQIPTPAKMSFHADTSFNKAMAFRLLKDAQLWRLVLGVLILHMVLTGFFLLMPPLFLSELGLSNSQHWIIYVPTVLIGFVLMAKFLRVDAVDKIRRYIMISIVGLAVTIGLLVPAMSLGILAVQALMIVFFASFNYVEATQPALVSRIAPPAGRGTAMALFAMGQFFGAFLGGALLGRVQESLGFSAAIIVLIVLLVIWLLLARSLALPAEEKTEMFEISTNWLGQRDILSDKLLALSGVKDLALPENETVAYLRVNETQLDRQALLQLLQEAD